MSLVPLLLNELYGNYSRPSRLLDQHFGCGLFPDELLEPVTIGYRLPSQIYNRPWRTALSTQETGSTITNDKEKFQVQLDVQQFKPEEITVKTVDGCIVVQGKHEEKEDEHGFISREFVRKYALPKGVKMEDVVSSLSSDGVLTVTGPKKALEDKSDERVIQIEQRGPVKAVKEKEEQPKK